MRSYDAAQDYDFEPDGHGGVRLIPKPRLARALERFKFRDAPMRFLPGKRKADDDTAPLFNAGAERKRIASFFGDQGEEEDPSSQYSPPNGGRVVATLDPPPEGMIYTLEEGASGWAVVLCDDDGTDNLTGNSTVDRTNIHTLHFPDGDPSLKRMNAINRRHWSRDARSRDREMTLFHHTPLPEERLELRRNPNGTYDLVLISADTPEISGRVPLGGEGEGDEITTRAPPRRATAVGDKGYRPGSEAAALHQQNVRHREFWRRR